MKKKIYISLFALFLIALGLFLINDSFKINKEALSGSQTYTLSSQAQWQAGSNENTDLTSSPGSILIDNKSDPVRLDISDGSVTTTRDDGGTANQIIDGIDNAGWWFQASSTTKQYATIDLGETKTFSIYKINPGGDAGGNYCSYYSTDNNSYTPLSGDIEAWGDDTNCVAGGNWTLDSMNDEYGMGFYADLIPAVEARYIQIEAWSGSGSDLVGVTNIDLYINSEATHTSSSSQLDCGENITSWDSLTPTQTTPTNTYISYEFRSSSDGATWTDWSSAQEYSGTPLDLSGLIANRYLQVRSTLSTTSSGSTPSIDEYDIAYTVSDADPCADFDHLNSYVSPAGSVSSASEGDEFVFTSHAVDGGGGYIDTSHSFEISPIVDGFSTSVSSGEIGEAVWNVPNDIAPGEYTVTISSGCGGSSTIVLEVPNDDDPDPDPEPDPDPVDVCDSFKNIKLDPAGGTYAAGRKIELSGYAIDESDSKMSGSLSYSLVSGSGNASLSDSGLLTMPLAGEKAIVSASHTCGSRSYTFSSYEIDCDELDHIELLPSSKELGKSQGYDFDAFAYRTDGSRYSSSQIGFNYTASKGSINSSGYHIASSTLGEYQVGVEDNGGCGVSDNSRVTVVSNPGPDPSGKGKLSIESPGGALDESGSVYTAYLDANNYSGETETCVNITPKMTYAGRDVTSKTNFNYELIYPTGVSRVDDQGIYCTSDISKVGRVDVGGIYGGRSYLVSQKINFYESDNDYFKVTRPNENSIWSIDSREDINWTSSELEEAIEQVKIEYSSNGGREYLGVVDNFPNTNNYSWQIPNDSSYASSEAKIRVSGYDSWGNYVISDESDQFIIKDKRDRVSPLDLKVDMSKLATTAAAQAPLMGLALIGLAWPYLIGAIGKNNFSLLTNFFGYLFQELKYLLSPYSKRPKKWGIVYDWDDKTPVAYAKLMLFDGESDKLKQVYYSNSKGEFGFKIEKEGEYYLEVEKPGYVIENKCQFAPNNSQVGKPGKQRDEFKIGLSDSYYSNLYFGQVFKVEDKEDSAVKMSIPLKLEERSWFSYLLVWLRRLSNFFYLIRIPVLIVGSLLALYLLVTQRTIIDLIVIGLYLIFWLIEILAAKKVRGYGLVKSEDDKPLDLVMVRAYDSTGRLVQTVITGPDGRFMLNIDPGDIILKIKKPGYASKIVEMDLKSVKDLSGVNIRLEQTSS